MLLLVPLLGLAIATACTGGSTIPPGPPSTTSPRESGGAGGSGGSTPRSGGGSGGLSALGGSAGDGAGGQAGAGRGGAGGKGGGSGRDAGRGGKDAAGRTDTATGGRISIVDGGAVACDDTESPDRLAVYYYSNSAATGSSIQMYFDVVNWTAFSSRLSQVTVKYWFTDEGAGVTNLLEQYYVPLPTNMKFVTLNPPRQDADTVLEISFTAAGDAGGSFVETRGFNFAFHKNSYTGDYDQTNDYSYDPKLKTSLGPNPRITAYIAGQLAWGCEPPPLPPGEPDPDRG